MASRIPVKIVYDHDGNVLHREEREPSPEEMEAICQFILPLEEFRKINRELA